MLLAIKSILGFLHISIIWLFILCDLLFHSSFFGIVPEIVTLFFSEIKSFSRSTVNRFCYSELFSGISSLDLIGRMMCSGSSSLMHGLNPSCFWLFYSEHFVQIHFFNALTPWQFPSFDMFHHTVTVDEHLIFIWFVLYSVMHSTSFFIIIIPIIIFVFKLDFYHIRSYY